MDSEHESEDDFNQNDDNRSDDGSERGGEMDDGKLNNTQDATCFGFPELRQQTGANELMVLSKLPTNGG